MIFFLKLTLKKGSSHSVFSQSEFEKCFHLVTITILHIFGKVVRIFELKLILKESAIYT